ncbi:hypothetical protein FA13DRAFT_298407 [Coprinellus micaceus]|uniref:Uncharacterized protein n=1 Tax=Coprinellus micaceus TaxID=71717 RepID=A0A4Y7SER9_COPMI|nr:hypothetical protein FA13DRAFT_298407 [Coprinellus micaceus]
MGVKNPPPPPPRGASKLHFCYLKLPKVVWLLFLLFLGPNGVHTAIAHFQAPVARESPANPGLAIEQTGGVLEDVKGGSAGFMSRDGSQLGPDTFSIAGHRSMLDKQSAFTREMHTTGTRREHSSAQGHRYCRALHDQLRL